MFVTVSQHLLQVGYYIYEAIDDVTNLFVTQLRGCSSCHTEVNRANLVPLLCLPKIRKYDGHDIRTNNCLRHEQKCI